MKRLAVLVAFLGIAAVAAIAPPGEQTEAQANCYVTGFCIDNAQFQRYYRERNEHNVLGYPISREFTLEGFRVQFFQRVVLQLQGNNVERLNILDPGIMPLTRANQSVFPASDPQLAASAPQVGSANYPTRVVEFVRSVAPDQFGSLPVNFFTTFNTTVPVSALAPDQQGNRDLITLLNLEIWGLPTSNPAPDPGNGGFVYQRFQRGIMHFRSECPCTEGILVGEYLKSVITGQNLPPDLAADMQGSRFLGQYNPSAPNSVARPAELQNTDMTNAFTTGAGQGPPPAPQPKPIAPPGPPAPVGPPATPVPTVAGDALPTITTFRIDDDVIDSGKSVEVTIIARDDKGVDWIQFEGIASSDDNGNDNTATDPVFDRQQLDCDNVVECPKVFSIKPTVGGDYTLRARARDTVGQRSEWKTVSLRVRPAPQPVAPVPSPAAVPR